MRGELAVIVSITAKKNVRQLNTSTQAQLYFTILFCLLMMLAFRPKYSSLLLKIEMLAIS